MKIFNSNKKIAYLISIILVIIVGTSLSMINFNPIGEEIQSKYPDFFTDNSDYYVTRIGSVPEIFDDTYSLTISGLVENETSFSLQELRELGMVEIPLTIECIGNVPNGRQISTAMWKGFVLNDLLDSLGIHENATGVRYLNLNLAMEHLAIISKTWNKIPKFPNSALLALYLEEVIKK